MAGCVRVRRGSDELRDDGCGAGGREHDVHMVEHHPVFHKAFLTTLGQHLGWEGSGHYKYTHTHTYTYTHTHPHTQSSHFNPTTLHPCPLTSDWDDGPRRLHTYPMTIPFWKSCPSVWFGLVWSYLSFRAAPALYGGSQARDPIRTVVVGLYHSHINIRSLIHWARSGIKPKSSWMLVRFSNHWAMTGTSPSVF